MGTANNKNMNLRNEYLERTRRPGNFLSPNSAQKTAWFQRALLIRSRKYTIYILKLGTWVGAGAPRLNPAPALRTPILLRKLMKSVALGVFGVHKQGVGTL